MRLTTRTATTTGGAFTVVLPAPALFKRVHSVVIDATVGGVGVAFGTQVGIVRAAGVTPAGLDMLVLRVGIPMELHGADLLVGALSCGIANSLIFLNVTHEG